MLTSKQRNHLRKLASELPDIVFIGKEGLSENLIKQTDEALEARELIKGKLQQNSAEDVREAAATLAKETRADVVATIGRKFILFRQKRKDSRYDLSGVQ